jgi:hypothetical protein
MLNELQGANSLELGKRYIYFGRVINNDDNNANGTITVRLENIDKTIADKDLPPCYPLLSQGFFYKLPQVGERVSVILDRKYNSNEAFNQEKRYWLGITNSSPKFLELDPYYFTASSHESDGYINNDQSIKNIPSALGTYPNPQDVALRGRLNTDIVLKNSEILLRTGRHLKNSVTTFNQQNASYIQIKHEKLNFEPLKQEDKIVTQVEIIPPKTVISLFISGLATTIKIIDRKNNTLIEQYGNTFSSESELITTVKEEIFKFQKKYPQWELRVPINAPTTLKSLSPIYPNNRKLNRVKITEKNANDVGQDKHINIVANKVNILSHLNNNFKLNDPESQITAEEQSKIDTEAHPLVYGDKLIELLELFKQYIVNHVHPYSGMKPAEDEVLRKIVNFPLDKIIDENIRIG